MTKKLDDRQKCYNRTKGIFKDFGFYLAHDIFFDVVEEYKSGNGKVYEDSRK